MALVAPRITGTEVCEYAVKPRAKPFFKTVLDAHALFPAGTRARYTTRVDGHGFEVRAEHELAIGKLAETCSFDASGVLRAERFTRTLSDKSGKNVREELVQFHPALLPMPEHTFPEVLLPFVLRGQPFDGERRALYSWTVDRFVARVYYEVVKRGRELDVPAGRFAAIEVVMYPDLNDWVPLGAVLTQLAKPMLPKYHMWFEAQPPHRVLRFEGPYGPPGAPELVLELAK